MPIVLSNGVQQALPESLCRKVDLAELGARARENVIWEPQTLSQEPEEGGFPVGPWSTAKAVIRDDTNVRDGCDAASWSVESVDDLPVLSVVEGESRASSKVGGCQREVLLYPRVVAR
jgi:hypothetical protein